MWSSFTITSPDPPAVVRDRVAAALTTAAPGWLSGPTTFRGEVWDTGFRVTRNLARMENSMPIIATARILTVGVGTAVEVATRPHWWLVILMGLWSASWVQLLWRRLMHEPLPGGIDWCEVVVLVAFAASGWFFLFAIATTEVREYQRALTRIVAPEVMPRPLK